MPSHDTFAWVLVRLNPEQFQQCFRRWVQSLVRLSGGQVIAIAGKTLRQSDESANAKAAIHVVSAWATQNRLVLGQGKVAAQANEITAMPQLRRVLEVSGCVITLDALGVT